MPEGSKGQIYPTNSWITILWLDTDFPFDIPTPSPITLLLKNTFSANPIELGYHGI